MNAREILSRQPPATLYHYTTQHGLLGIVESKEIWASHTQYLNDAREFRYAIEIVREQIAEIKREPLQRRYVNLLEEMELDLDGVESINVCVCSFSAEGDALSQWRAYSHGGSGFSIGFSGAFLREVTNSLDFWLVPVLYQAAQQRALIRTLLEDVLDENSRLKQVGQEDPVRQPGGGLVAYLNRYAPILKHQSFSEEQEWRIVSRPLFCSREGFGYRSGTSMLIPYYRIPLSSEKLAFCVGEVVVGPTPHPEQSERSVRGLLIQHGLRDAFVRQSNVPYRNW